MGGRSVTEDQLTVSKKGRVEGSLRSVLGVWYY